MGADRHRLLRRYTTLPIVLELLRDRKLTLTDPSKWPDQNDSFTIGVYKTNRRLQSILATCFTGIEETYHHWKVFGGGDSGMCIVFRRALLEECLRSFRKKERIRYGLAKYRRLDTIRNRPLEPRDLPFIKRIGYKDEREYRVLWVSKTETAEFVRLPIPLRCIEAIIINPWLRTELAETLRGVLEREVKSSSPDHEIAIKRSSLINSSSWKQAFIKRFLPLAGIVVVPKKPN